MPRFKIGTIVVIDSFFYKKEILLILGFDPRHTFAYAVFDLVSLSFDRYDENYINQHAEILF